MLPCTVIFPLIGGDFIWNSKKWITMLNNGYAIDMKSISWAEEKVQSKPYAAPDWEVGEQLTPLIKC
jgi:hypothetical protein